MRTQSQSQIGPEFETMPPFATSIREAGWPVSRVPCRRRPLGGPETLLGAPPCFGNQGLPIPLLLKNIGVSDGRKDSRIERRRRRRKKVLSRRRTGKGSAKRRESWLCARFEQKAQEARLAARSGSHPKGSQPLPRRDG